MTSLATAFDATSLPKVENATARLADARRGDRASLISPAILAGLVRLADVALVLTLGLVIAALYVEEPEAASSTTYLAASSLSAVGALAIFEALGLYSSLAFRSIMRQLPRLALGWLATLGLVAATLFFLKSGPELSRVWLASWGAASLAGLVSLRLLLAALVSRWSALGRLDRRAVIYGAGEVTSEMIRQLERDTGLDIRIAGIFDDRGTERAGGTVAGYPHLGSLKDLVSFSRETRVDLVIVTLPVAAERRLADVVKQLSVLPADVKLTATSTALRFSARTYSHIGSVAMIDIADKPIAGWGGLSKWAFDKFVASLALVLLAPVMAAVAVAIKLDSRGPVFFRQKRYGFNNELIEVWKFRSMHTSLCDANAAKLVTKGDPRVTRVGRIIRKTSLDELPQLFNVLTGELSLVGPRPHAMQAKAADRQYDEAVDGYFARHKVKPGITGWAQINGWRGETDTLEKIAKRVECDIFYIENWSLMLDLFILAKTPLSLLKTENAY